jgi:hypothetical protein
MSQINFEKSVVKYTVKLNNLKKGTITAIECEEIKVGDFAHNVQFVDEFGNNVGRSGYIDKILSTKVLI